jgi:pentose-5-phosphate-3-epimerase
VATEGQTFYGTSSMGSVAFKDVLEGRIIKINPALIAITDGTVDTTPSEIIQQKVQDHVIQLLGHKVRTFHVDVNFEDYSGFGSNRPDINTAIFTPSFLENLNEVVRSYDGFLNLHLLTDFPQRHLRRFGHIELGAVCFQLEVISDSKQLKELIHNILDSGACASPVIETVGSENLMPKPKEEIFIFLEPVLSEIGMLTFQAAGTASRSNVSAGTFAKEQVRSYIERMKELFTGTIQLQGGITTSSIGEAVKLGAEFMVSGTQIFRNQDGLTPPEVIDIMLTEAAKALAV